MTCVTLVAMAQLKKKSGPKGLIVSIEGPIDDRDELEKELGQFLGSLTVHCEAVTRINSIGVKKWMKFFQDLRNKNVDVYFEAVSPALVEQFNQVKNFGCGGSVISFMLPYRCAPCNHNFSMKELVQQVRAKGSPPPHYKCPKCGKDAEFDELPEEYCSFIFQG